ncbi:MAG: hypothetical protein JSV04_01375 [Candidatus Heimdallarchaeota archaeon]|nr:MAG: hypothetical protein JSV04_01375 [Candidatus Heimdallarchaeota archaeon]
MPFAKKYSKHMKLPKEGEFIDNFLIELVKIEHIAMGSGKYEYPTEMIVSGKGGKKQVKDVFKKLFDQRITLFSGYGNPYQCQGGRMEIESLGERKYKIKARGSCVRFFLKRELYEFLLFLVKNDYLPEKIDEKKLIEDYIKIYHRKTAK